MLRKLLGEEKGSAIILVTVAMTVLIGMAALAVDGGLEYVHKSQLQNAVDAAALAGAQGLTKDSTGVMASSIALTYLEKNSVKTPDTNKIVLSESNGTNCTKITVSATRKYYWGLAQIFNIKDADGKLVNYNDITATAAARLLVTSKTNGLGPFGCLAHEVMFTGNNVILKAGAQGGIPTWDVAQNKPGPDWRRWVTLDGQTGGGLGDIITTGSKESSWFGKLEDIYGGTDMSSGVKSAIENKAALCTSGCTPSNFMRDCPSIMFVPVIEDYDTGTVDNSTHEPIYGVNLYIDSNNQASVKVVGFAAFHIESMQGQDIVGFFVKTVKAGTVGPNGGGQNFGLSTPILVQ